MAYAIRIEVEEAPTLGYTGGRPDPPFLVRAVQEFNDHGAGFFIIEAFQAMDLPDEDHPADEPWVRLNSNDEGAGVTFTARQIPGVIDMLRAFQERWPTEQDYFLPRDPDDTAGFDYLRCPRCGGRGMPVLTDRQLGPSSPSLAEMRPRVNANIASGKIVLPQCRRCDEQETA